MIRTKVLLAVFFGTLLYVVMSVIGGPNGFWAMKQLEEQKNTISIHTAEIAKTNDMLSLEYMALKQDMDVVAAYARRLGYVGKGEKLVKISGLATYYEPIYDTGFVLKLNPILSVPENICKICGFIIGLLSFVLMIFNDMSDKNYMDKNDDKKYTAGIKTSSFESIAGIKVESI